MSKHTPPSGETLLRFISHGISIAANTCYIVLQQGIGTVLYIANNEIHRTATITPAVFADCNAFVHSLLSPTTNAQLPMRSGGITFTDESGPHQAWVSTYKHIEPVICLSLNNTPLTPITFAELDVSHQAVMAYRKVLNGTRKNFIVLSGQHNASSDSFIQAVFGELSARQAVGPTTFVGNPPAITSTLVHRADSIESASASEAWDKSLVVLGNVDDVLAQSLPSLPQAHTYIIADNSSTELADATRRAMMLCQNLGSSTAIYTQEFPRLCPKCSIGSLYSSDEYFGIVDSVLKRRQRTIANLESTALTAKNATSTNPSRMRVIAPLTTTKDLATKNTSLIERIARDPAIVDRSVADKQVMDQTVKSLTLWNRSQQTDCSMCHGSGYFGSVLACGSGDVAAVVAGSEAAIDAATIGGNQISRAFWEDLFDKAEMGLISASQVTQYVALHLPYAQHDGSP